MGDVDVPLSCDEVMNITIETSSDQEMFASQLCEESALSHVDGNDRHVLEPEIPSEHVYVVDDGVEDDNFKSGCDNITPKKRFISSLQTLIDVIEKVQTDEVLSYAASGIEELTNTFIPLIDNQDPHDGIT